MEPNRPADFSVGSAMSLDGEAFVTVTADGRQIEWTPSEAEDVGATIIRCAGQAESAQALFEGIMATGAPKEAAIGAVQQMARFTKSAVHMYEDAETPKEGTGHGESVPPRG